MFWVTIFKLRLSPWEPGTSKAEGSKLVKVLMRVDQLSSPICLVVGLNVPFRETGFTQGHWNHDLLPRRASSRQLYSARQSFGWRCLATTFKRSLWGTEAVWGLRGSNSDKWKHCMVYFHKWTNKLSWGENLVSGYIFTIQSSIFWASVWFTVPPTVFIYD